jgi:hypothetical protein
MSFGSCQYDDIYYIVEKNIKKVLGKNKVDDFSKVIKIGFEFCPEISLEEAKIEILKMDLEIYNSEIMEKIDIRDILESTQTDKILITIKSKLEELKNRDRNNEDVLEDGLEVGLGDDINEILEYIEPLIKVDTVSGFVNYISGECWDLWGCIRIITPFFGLKIPEYGGVETAYGILYLIWKYDIDNWKDTFSGFAT